MYESLTIYDLNKQAQDSLKKIHTLIYQYQQKQDWRSFLLVTAYEFNKKEQNQSGGYQLVVSCTSKCSQEALQLEGQGSIVLGSYQETMLYVPIAAACMELLDNNQHAEYGVLWDKIFQILLENCGYSHEDLKEVPRVESAYKQFLPVTAQGNITKENIRLAEKLCRQKESDFDSLTALHAHQENLSLFIEDKNTDLLQQGLIIDW